MKSILSTIMLLAMLVAQAQDVIGTGDGDVEVTPILHGTLVLTWNDQTIYVDPYGGAEVFEGISPPTIVLITDIHGDHHNQKTLDALDLANAKMIVPQAVADKMGDSDPIVISNGESKTVNGVSITAIPMYNLTEGRLDKHVKGRGNGYVLGIGGKNFYLSGDTEDIPEMRALEEIDVAFVCMNLPYTMDIKQAASAVSEFKPKVMYPYHYRGPDGLSDIEEFKRLVNESTDQVEVRLRNWYPGN